MEVREELSIESKLGCVWFTMPPSIDLDNYQKIESHIEKIIDDSSRHVVLDLDRLEHLYSSGIGLLLRLHQKIAKLGWSLYLVNVPAKIHRILHLVNLDKILTLYDTDVEFEISQENIWNEKQGIATPRFLIFYKEETDYFAITLSGSMTSAHDLSGLNQTLVEGSDERYLFDFTGLESMDSNGANRLRIVLQKIADRGKKASGYGANDTIRELFTLLNLDTLCPLYVDARQAADMLFGD